MDKKYQLPKSISFAYGKYVVKINVKKHVVNKERQIHVGVFDTLDDAVIAREKFILENYQGVANGYLPRGISKHTHGRYIARFSYFGKLKYLGIYNTVEKAIEARYKYIDSLK